MKVKSESEVAQSYPTVRDPMDCSPPGSSVHVIFQARVLEWGAIAFIISILMHKNKYIFLKKLNRITMLSRNFTPGYIPRSIESTLESPWDYKEMKPVHPKGNQS